MKDISASGSLMPAFATDIYKTELAGTSADSLVTRLDTGCRRMAVDDREGQQWSKRNGYPGYTSYPSVPDPADVDDAFAELKPVLAYQAALFAAQAQLDLGGKKLRVTRLWINLLEPNGAQPSHIHTHSVLSGTLYTSVPENSGKLRFEDPRLGMMMHAPARLPDARLYRQTFIPVIPQRGTLLLWESWLRQEITTNLATGPSVSLSFNLNLEN
ncbi:TIGR02466 family protein [Asticcacaulis sp. BYS171W]|uniref:TIGR02466 family protein n=1 Tax=Asticcacaulis aquaticus TaxID=2984212 RepID=A0ABT5HX89_9CAUL|nr:TIGR02466 family protein [Asticcacaulis aquaticus]MDC7684673.1 TIGR02466 family protein [Asticcacaulis aquaticus]